MSWSDLLAITPSPVLSVIVLLLLASIVLYFARVPARPGRLHLGNTLYLA